MSVSVVHHLPLQLRLIATVAIALLITACLSVVPIYWHAKSKVATEMQAALAVGEQVAKNEIQTGESSRDLSRRLELMIAHFNGDRHIRAKLVTKTGGAISTSRLAPPDETAPAWFYRFINAKPHVSTIALRDALPPLHQVIIEADPTNEVGEAWTDLTTFAGILGLFCLLVLGSVSWIVTRAIKPIQSLLTGYSEIGAGNLKVRVTPSGSRELEQLCYGFNEMGDELEQMDARNARLTQQLEDVQEEERADLARDLHDEVSPLLFAADVDAAMISKLAKTNNQKEIAEQTESIRTALRQLKKTVTLLLGRLRPAVLLDQGLSVAIDNLVSTSKRRHPSVAFNVSVAEFDADVATQSAMFFVVREAVANALRHGKPETVAITIAPRKDRSVVLQVNDDGRGLPSEGLKPGFGLRGIEERVVRLGGTLSITANPMGQGMKLEAHLPTKPRAEPLPDEQLATQLPSDSNTTPKESALV